MKPSTMPRNSIVKPISQLSSRGLRNAPVKKIRSMWTIIAATNRIAAQWWIWRSRRPPRMSNEMSSVEAYASDMCRPLSIEYEPWYSTSVIDGLNQKVRNVPDSSRMMKLYSAISPSMNDQWSGKTLRSACLNPDLPMPSRSSRYLTGGANLVAMSAFSSFPEARPGRLREGALRHQVALGVDHDRQLRQRPCGRAEDHLGVVRQVEGRLVARAEHVVRLLLVQGDRAPDVGADLGVAQDPVDAPVLPTGLRRDLLRVDPDQDHRGFRLGILVLDRVLLLELLEVARERVDELADHEVGRLDRPVRDVVHDPDALGPDGLEQPVAGRRAEVAQQHDGRQAERAHRADQGPADQRPAGEAGLLGALGEDLEDLFLLLVGGVRGVPLLDDLAVHHQLLRPLDGAGADQEQRQADAHAERQVQRVRAQRADPDDGVLRDREVRDHEHQRQQRGDPEHGRDLALDAGGRGWVGVGDALLVRLQARVGDRVLDRVGEHQVTAVRVVHLGGQVVVAHSACPPALTPLAPIHTATAISAPMPSSQPHRPSVTGPSRPSAKPPGSLSLSIALV